MEAVKSLNKWANAHSYYSLVVVRIALGVFLFIKGFSFMSQSQYLMEIVEPLKSYGGLMVLVHYVAPAHLVGGVLITFGLITRWAALVQLPILMGAVVINFMGAMHPTNLILSTVALLLSLFFIIYGSGRYSADYFFKMRQ